MRKLAISFILALLTLASLTAAVAEKVTSDPNVPGAKSAQQVEEEPQDHDSALDKKITYDGPDLDLTKMLAEVSLASGVKMQPSAKAESWQVRQRTAVVFLNDAPLSEFKNGLGKLFGYRWTRVTAGSGQRSYVIREIAIQKATRQGKIDAAKQAEIDARKDSILRAIQDVDKALSLTPGELKEARDKDPWLYYLATNPAGKKWAEVIRSVPQDWWQQVAEGSGKRVNVADASDPASKKIIGLLEAIRTLPPSATAHFGSSTGSEPSRYQTYRADPLDRFQIESDMAATPGGNAAMIFAYVRHTHLVNGGTTQAWSTETIDMCPIGPSMSSACLTAGYRNALSEDGTPLEQVGQAAIDKSCDYFNAKNKDPEPDTKTDPALLKEIEHKPIPDPKRKDEPNLIAHLRGLAKETGFTMMLETFDDDRNVSPKSAWAPDKGKIFDILSDLAKTGRMTWEKSGNVVMFRYTEWPKLRTLEVSRDLIKRWEDAAKAHDMLTFDDLYDVVSNTTYDQISKTLVKNKLLDLAGLGGRLTYGPTYPSLRIMAMLPDDSARSLFKSETGVPVKLLRDLDLASDPIAVHFKDWFDTAFTKDPAATAGVLVGKSTDPNHCRESIRSFVRYSDGKTDKTADSIGCPNETKEFRDYVKALEKPAVKS